MKKVLVCGIGAGRGGIGSVIYNTIKEIDRNSITFTVLLTYDTVWEEDFKKLNIPVIKITPFGKSIKKYKQDLKEKVFAKEKFDFVWVNNTSKVDIEIFKIAKRNGAKTISHSHGVGAEGSFVKRFLYKVCEIFTSLSFYKYVDISIACSQNSAEYFYGKKYMKTHDVHVLLNSVDTNEFQYVEDKRISVRKELHLTDEKAVFAVGRITKVKNPQFMLRLISLLPTNYKLFLVGEGELSDEIKRAVNELNLMNKVVLLGSRDDVATLLNGADIYILPSFEEGFPVAVIEAQANGLPCYISSNVTEEVVLFDSCRRIDLDNSADWVKAILSAEDLQRVGYANKVREMGFDNIEYAKKFEKILLSN